LKCTEAAATVAAEAVQVVAEGRWRSVVGRGGDSVRLTCKAVGRRGDSVMARKAKDPNAPIRIGFIGTGGIAQYQMSLLAKIPNVELVAAADVNTQTLEKVQKDYGFTKLYKDWTKVIAHDDLDAVSVCTPNGMHCAPTVAALKSGKHVLVEKPLAMNAKEGQQMVDAAKKAKKLLQIAFQWRFTHQAQMLRKAFDEGQFGKILYVRCQAMRRRGIPNWGVFGRKELQGGGPMIDIGVHILEAAHYAIGSPKPIAASGQTYTYLGNKKSNTQSMWPNWDYKTYNVEDLAVGFIRFDNGATLTIESSFVAHMKENECSNIQIMGANGGGTYNPAEIFTDHAGYMMNMTPAFMHNVDGFHFKMQHFIDCIRGQAQCMATGEDGLMVQKMLDGIYQSAAAGKEVVIK
jgi:predicted dehydrogenase